MSRLFFRRAACVLGLGVFLLGGVPAAWAQSPTYLFSTLAGGVGQIGYFDGAGTAARFNLPIAIAADAAGTLYVADTYNHVIRKVTPSGVVSTLAGALVPGSTDGVQTLARFREPLGIAVDGGGNVYVADGGNHTIRKISPAGEVSTLAGSPGLAGSADGVGSSARFNAPQQIAVDAAGNVYVADYLNHTLRKVSAAGVVTTLAGTAGVAGSADGFGTAAQFFWIAGVAVTPAGEVFVADQGNHTIRRISVAGEVTTLAGRAGAPGALDGAGAAARFHNPWAIAVDAAGTLYVTEQVNNTVRRVSASGVVTTIGGTAGASGWADGVGANARFIWPRGITVTSGGTLFLVDESNHVLRKAEIVAVSIVSQPQAQTVVAGSAVSFSIGVTGSAPFTFQWRKGGVTIAGATAASFAIASAQPADAGNYDVVVTNSAGTVTSSSALLTVGQAPAITVQPVSQSVPISSVVGFTVSATGTAPLTYQWRKNGVNFPGATTTSHVMNNLQADAAAVYDVVVTNAYGSVTSAGATLSLTPAVWFTGQPESQSVFAGADVSFTGAAAGFAATPTYQWRKDGVVIPGATNATLTLTSVAPAAAGFYDVVATTSRGSANSNAANLVVTAAKPTITVQPQAGTIALGGNSALNVGVVGSLPMSFQWRRNGLDVPGATQAALSFQNAQLHQAGDYSVEIANSLGITLSNAVRINVIPRVGSYSARLLIDEEGALATFVIEGTVAKKVLLRVVGPGLSPFGLSGLPDPRLEVFDRQGVVVAMNDNWGAGSDAAGIAATTAAVGAFALGNNSKDAAVVVTLPAGAYSVRARAASGPGGVGYLELYDADLSTGPVSAVPYVAVRGRLGGGGGGGGRRDGSVEPGAAQLPDPGDWSGTGPAGSAGQSRVAGGAWGHVGGAER
jgi:hypothetical protein